MSHVRSNARQPLPPIPAPPDTAEGFATMDYAQRVALHGRDVALYRQLAAQEQANAGRVTR